MSHRALFAAVLVSLASALVPARTRACTCSPNIFYHSEPKGGATAVPLNIAVVVEGLLVTSSLEWTDERGMAVEFAVNQGPQVSCPSVWAELVPKTALAPNTRYTIRAESSMRSGDTKAFSFTTGSELLPDQPLLPPRATASMVSDAPGAMCGGGTVFGCLAIEDPNDIELIARQGDSILLRATRYVRGDTSFSLRDKPDCIELRRRSATGKRSEPLSICGEALRIRPFRDSDVRQQVILCQDGKIGDYSASDSPSAGAGGSQMTDVSISAAGASAADVPMGSSAGAGSERSTAQAAGSSGCGVAAGSSRDFAAGALVLLLMAAYLGRCSRWC